VGRSADGGHGAPAGTGSVVRPALRRFAISSVVAALVLVAGSFFVAQQVARSRALDQARVQGEAIAHRLVAPLVDADVRAGRPEATARLRTVMETRMQDGSLRHVKVWSADGRLIWADDPTLVGRQFDLSEEVEALVGSTRSIAELSELTKEENAEERADGELLEVYVGAEDNDGVPLVFEAYLTTDQMERDASRIVTTLVPFVAMALVLFLAVVMPLALSLGRRVERARTEQAKMTRHALLASDLERRRIAEDLHDGVIQDLAGLAYVLPSTARLIAEGGDREVAGSAVERAAGLVQRDVLALRSLMADIYPPDLQREALGDAVRQLVSAESKAAGIDAQVHLAGDLMVSHDAGRLVYRVVREGLRNVVKHADAQNVTVEVAQDVETVEVRVVDDGRGPGAGHRTGARGHLGLQLLRDTIHDFGGSLELRAREEGGAVLDARFPAVLVST